MKPVIEPRLLEVSAYITKFYPAREQFVYINDGEYENAIKVDGGIKQPPEIALQFTDLGDVTVGDINKALTSLFLEPTKVRVKIEIEGR